MYYRETDQAIPEETGTDVLRVRYTALQVLNLLTYHSLLKQSSGNVGLLISDGKRPWQIRWMWFGC
jgi:hypothetical protein